MFAQKQFNCACYTHTHTHTHTHTQPHKLTHIRTSIIGNVTSLDNQNVHETSMHESELESKLNYTEQLQAVGTLLDKQLKNVLPRVSALMFKDLSCLDTLTYIDKVIKNIDILSNYMSSKEKVITKDWKMVKQYIMIMHNQTTSQQKIGLQGFITWIQNSENHSNFDFTNIQQFIFELKLAEIVITHDINFLKEKFASIDMDVFNVALWMDWTNVILKKENNKIVSQLINQFVTIFKLILNEYTVLNKFNVTFNALIDQLELENIDADFLGFIESMFLPDIVKHQLNSNASLETQPGFIKYINKVTDALENLQGMELSFWESEAGWDSIFVGLYEKMKNYTGITKSGNDGLKLLKPVHLPDAENFVENSQLKLTNSNEDVQDEDVQYEESITSPRRSESEW